MAALRDCLALTKFYYFKQEITVKTVHIHTYKYKYI